MLIDGLIEEIVTGDPALSERANLIAAPILAPGVIEHLASSG